MGAREVLAQLRAETKRPAIEDLEHQAREEERAEQYVVALHAERQGVLAELVQLRRLRPDSREWMGHELQVGEPPTAAQRIRTGEQRVRSIDAELERVGG